MFFYGSLSTYKKHDPFVSGQNSLYECCLDDNRSCVDMSNTSEYVCKNLSFPQHGTR